MNGNDYVEIEEKMFEQILSDYVESLDFDDIPDDFKEKWVSNYLQGE